VRDDASVTDDEVRADEPADEPVGRRRRRLWPLTCAGLVLLTIVWIAVTAWSGIRGSHPAYLITLAVVAVGAIAVAVWAWRSPAPDRTSLRRGLTRAALVLATLLMIGLVVYLRPLSASQVAVDAMDDGDGVDVTVTRGEIRLDPDDPVSTGLVFYPGALVDPRAYAHILRPVAEAGHPVVIIKFPYNLAIVQNGAAGRVVGDRDDDITQWVLGGHSLGGAMASAWSESPRDELVGLLLYAAYPVNPMTGVALDVVSIYGTEDQLATVDDIDASRDDLPADTTFITIEGGVHAFFGDYGSQRGDGTPTISRADAQEQIITATLEMLERVTPDP
jgi:hypothetical protein